MHFDQRTQRGLAGAGLGRNDLQAASVATVTVDVGVLEAFVDDADVGYPGVDRAHSGGTSPDREGRVTTDHETLE